MKDDVPRSPRRCCCRPMPRASSRWPRPPRRAELFWVDPARRGILPLDGAARRRAGWPAASCAATSRSASTRDFAGVVAACADRPETWINGRSRGSTASCTGSATRTRSRSGRTARWPAASTAWRSARAFFGESMFSRRRDASKLALIALVARLRSAASACSTPSSSPTTWRGLGAVEIGRAAYHRRLQAALARPGRFLALPADRRAVSRCCSSPPRRRSAGGRAPTAPARRRTSSRRTAALSSRTSRMLQERVGVARRVVARHPAGLGGDLEMAEARRLADPQVDVLRGAVEVSSPRRCSRSPRPSPRRRRRPAPTAPPPPARPASASSRHEHRADHCPVPKRMSRFEQAHRALGVHDLVARPPA